MPKAVANENPLPPVGTSLLNVNLFSVRHLNVLVTGGASGIGAMIAAAFVENGAQVLICSRKDGSSYAEELCRRARRVSDHPSAGTCKALAGVDVTKPKDLEKLRDWVTSEVKANYERLNTGATKPMTVHRSSGMLDVLVNNSGTNYANMLENYDVKMFSKVQ